MRKLLCLFLVVVLLTVIMAMPAQAKTFYGEQCTGGAECACLDYIDLDPLAWYHVGVDFVLCAGYMTGYGNDVFGPNDPVTRAQLVQILFNMEGKPLQRDGYSFVDVKGSDWFFDAYRWAFSNQIVTPTTPGVFAPRQTATRQEAITLLYNYASFKGRDVSKLAVLGVFRDAASVSSAAHTAMAWAVEAGILTGTDDGMIAPFDSITRAQWATILQRYCG